MAYNKKTWVSKETITKEALNNIENGIAELDANQKNFLTEHQDLSAYATKLEVGSPLIANNISEMTDVTKVYVNTSDNNWYSYNGNGWVIGGLYNSQGIADGSITANKTNFINVSQNIINPSLIKNGYSLDYSWNSASTEDYNISSISVAYQDAIEAKIGDIFYSNAGGRCVWYKENGLVGGNASFSPDNETGLFKVTVGGGVKVKFDGYISEINAYGGYWFVCKAPYLGVKQQYGDLVLSNDLKSNIFAKEEDLLNLQENVNSLLKPTLDSTFFIPKKVYCLNGTEGGKWLFKQNIVISKNYDEFYLDSTAPNGAYRGINGDIQTQKADEIKVKSSKDNSVLYKVVYNRCVANYKEKTNPSEIKNIMIIGDSLSDAGYIPCDIKDQIVNKFGFTNFNFIGTKEDVLLIDGTDNTVTCKNEGRGGYAIDDFMKNDNSQGRGEAYPNPFLNNGTVSIRDYMTRNNFNGDLDYLIVELGTNNIVGGLGDDVDSIKTKMKSFIDLILNEYPNCKIFICGLVCVSRINGTYDFINHNTKILNVNKAYETMCEDASINENCTYVDINTFFDVEFAYPYLEQTYRGSNEIKKIITDWLHPSKAGYYMISDTIVSSFIYTM